MRLTARVPPRRILAPLTAVCSLCLAHAATAQKAQTAGVYVDAKGAQHAWNISPTHALFWDGQSYVPVGGTFAPHYLAEGQTDDNWQRDAKALQVLKSRGVTDVIIDPVVSAADIPAPAWQKLVDYLEQSGFHYGIGFGSGVRALLTGTVVKPGSYRVRDISENLDVSWNVTDSDSARYVFADKDGLVLRTGDVRVQNGIASVAADSRLAGGAVGLLYPRKSLKPQREGYLPDLWSGFDSYRDRLLKVFTAVKFGAGLRFFLDPLAHSLAVLGETEYVVPDSPAFRLEWEAYLTQRYPSVDDLMNAWALVDRDIKDHRTAAQLVPLWVNRRGVGFMLNTVTGKLLAVDPVTDKSRFWADMRECRNDGIVYYMNAAADFLKREVANVPVVYTYTGQHRMFTNPGRKGGFDGIGIAAYGRGSALVTGGADSAFSQCNESQKTLWLVVTETLDSASPAKESLGYASQQALFQDLDWLRGIGAKGFFVRGFQVLPEAANRNCQLITAPDQVDWLKSYDERLHKEVDIAAIQPRTLPFPTNAAGLVHAGPIGSGVWWVPSLAPGKPLEFGSSYAGYTISLPDGEATVLWSLMGPRETRLFVGDPRRAEITTPDGRAVPCKPNIKKGIITLTMDENPIIIRAGQEEVFPLEAAEDALKQLQSMLVQATAAKLPVEQYRYMLDNAINAYRRNPRTGFNMAAEALNGIGAEVQPFTWLEAELAEPHSFSEVQLSDAASGGAILALNTETRPPSSGYAAQFRFTAPADDVYFVWIACTPPGPQASPFAWIIDTDQPHTSVEARVVGQPYLNDRMIWLNLGRVQLKRGIHTFTLRVMDRASGTARYTLALDAAVITRFPFSPSGIAKPPLAPVNGQPLPTLSYRPEERARQKKAKRGKN